MHPIEFSGLSRGAREGRVGTSVAPGTDTSSHASKIRASPHGTPNEETRPMRRALCVGADDRTAGGELDGLRWGEQRHHGAHPHGNAQRGALTRLDLPHGSLLRRAASQSGADLRGAAAPRGPERPAYRLTPRPRRALDHLVQCAALPERFQRFHTSAASPVVPRLRELVRRFALVAVGLRALRENTSPFDGPSRPPLRRFARRRVQTTHPTVPRGDPGAGPSVDTPGRSTCPPQPPVPEWRTGQEAAQITSYIIN